MIDNKILELNIRLILNVLCLKRKLLNTDIRHDKMIHLIKKNLFPLIPSLLSFLNDKKLFLALHSFKSNVNILQSLIEHQRSNSQIATNNDYDFHGNPFFVGPMAAHVIGTPIVIASDDLGSTLDLNGIRWVGSGNFGIYGILGLFGKKLAAKYLKLIDLFNVQYDEIPQLLFIEKFFNVFLKPFILNNKKELKFQYDKNKTNPNTEHSLYIISNYKIKCIIFPKNIDNYRTPITPNIKSFIALSIKILKINNIPYQFLDENGINNYIKKNINYKYHTWNMYDTKIHNYQYFLHVVKNTDIKMARIPDKYKTYLLCLAAVKNDGTRLLHIPLKLKTYLLCLAAVDDFPSIIAEVPLKYKEQIKRELRIHA